MAGKMTSHERFSRMYAHKEADRVPITDYPWASAIERWQREGMPKNVDWIDYFDVDRRTYIQVDNSPQYPEEVVEETDRYTIKTTKWGAKLRNWKHATSTPEFLDFKIKDRDSWEAAKKRMGTGGERIAWDKVRADYKKWREQGAWIEGAFWFGFDVTHSWTIGTERTLMALAEDPEWCVDMFNHLLTVNIALFDTLWDAGIHFDSIHWWDDMGYKHNQFFSLHTYRDLLKPAHKRAIDWAHAHGIPAHLHSCGCIMPFVPDLVAIGLDGLNPLEVKAGMDPLALKKQFGDRLLLHGGINALLWDNFDAVAAEMKRYVPALKENGGYILASDHSIPDSVSLENFTRIIQLAKELGKY